MLDAEIQFDYSTTETDMLLQHKKRLDAMQGRALEEMKMKMQGKPAKEKVGALERRLGREIQAIIDGFGLSMIAYDDIFVSGSAPVRM